MAATEPAAPLDDRDRLGLRADCANCFGLCCVALPFSASADFAIDKDAGQPCLHLRTDFRCGIHDRLRQQGFPGCAAYDCFGAGQKVSQITFGGHSWREGRQDPQDNAKRMFEVFPIMRQLHELLWYLGEALTLRPARRLHPAIRRARHELERFTGGSPESLTEVDIPAHRREIDALLLRTSELVRASVMGPKLDRSGADLIGADLGGADLRGANLRGAFLIGASLSGADLTSADLLGADLRGADLGGADLTESIFLPQSALDAARGDRRTTLPPALTRPAHWAAADKRAAARIPPEIRE